MVRSVIGLLLASLVAVSAFAPLQPPRSTNSIRPAPVVRVPTLLSDSFLLRTIDKAMDTHSCACLFFSCTDSIKASHHAIGSGSGTHCVLPVSTICTAKHPINQSINGVSQPAALFCDILAVRHVATTAATRWFFGSSGGAGIALTAFPKMYTRFRYIQELKSVGPTLGGPTIGINTLLCGYPEDIAIADVDQVVNNPLSVEQIVDKFPQEGNFLTEQG